MGKIFFEGIEQDKFLSDIKESQKELLSEVEERVNRSIKEELSTIIEVVDRKLSTKEAARILKCDEQTVRKHQKNGILENANYSTGQFKFWLSDVIALKQNWRKYARNYVQ